jgi:hypothetical protein
MPKRDRAHATHYHAILRSPRQELERSGSYTSKPHALEHCRAWEKSIGPLKPSDSITEVACHNPTCEPADCGIEDAGPACTAERIPRRISTGTRPPPDSPPEWHLAFVLQRMDATRGRVIGLLDGLRDDILHGDQLRFREILKLATGVAFQPAGRPVWFELETLLRELEVEGAKWPWKTRLSPMTRRSARLSRLQRRRQ